MPTTLKKSPENNDNDYKNNLLVDQGSKEITTFSSQRTLSNHESEETANDSQEDANSSIEGLRPKKKFRIGKIFTMAIIVLCVAFLTVGGYAAYRIASAGQSVLGQGENLSFVDQTKQIFGTLLNPTNTVELKGESNGRTNFLLIGVDATANLTDTIMIGSYYHKEAKFVTLNIPRDTRVFDGYETQKINGVFNGAVARSKNKTQSDLVGAEALSNLLSKEFGIPIHYWAKVNFNGIKQIVDELGGIEVDVPRDLYDNLYPNDGYKVINGSPYLRPAPNFKKGIQTMDGKTALIYARSRETTSDFDRNERQSIVIQAILEKLKSQKIFENVSKITSYLNIVGNNFKTNLQVNEIYSLSKKLEDINLDTNFLRVIWSTGNGILCPGNNSQLGYTITYCGGAIIGRSRVSTSKTKAKNNVQNLLKTAEQAELFDSEVALISNRSSEIFDIKRELEKIGFSTVKVNNRSSQITAIKQSDIENTSLYILDSKVRDLYQGLEEKPESISTEISDQLPDGFKLAKSYENAKIVLIID
ncbi:MAG: LCP family protein [Patescibacteria group bacterium]